jgi:hypothetical protein
MAVSIVPASGTWSITRGFDTENLLGKQVYTQVLTGITAGNPKAVYNTPPTASFTVFPTSAGTATLYYSVSDENKCRHDILNNIIGTGKATWVEWVTVTAITQDTNNITSTSVALKVSSGTWTMETCSHG